MLLMSTGLNKSLCKKLCKHLIEAMEKNGNVFENESVSRTIELMLGLKNRKIYSLLVEKFFGSRLLELSQHPIANFAVQKLLLHCEDSEMVRIN